MVDNCRHVSKIKSSLYLGILTPERWQCNYCGTTESIWACLHCSNIACGRYIEEHALQHFNKTGHPLCIEINEKFVFCYECDDFVLNDNAPGDLKLLRMALDAVAAQNFESLSSTERGRRILRSNILTETSKKSRRLMRADHVHTALVKNRIFQLSCAFRKWFDAYVKKAQEKSGMAASNLPSANTTNPLKKRGINFQPGTTGLRNLGNTCYMNSVLQILCHSAAFSNFIVGHNPSEVIPQSRKYPYVHQTTLECFEVVDSPCKKAAVVMLGSDRASANHMSSLGNITDPYSSTTTLSKSGKSTQTNSSTYNASKPGGLNGGSSNIRATEALTYASSPAHSLYEELHALFRVLWSGKRSVVSPHSLLYAIWVAVPSFKGYKQQDAQEFLGILLDKLQNELHEPAVGWDPNLQDFITRAFQGRLISHVTCTKCSHVTTTEDPFLDLSLAFPSACQSGESDICDLSEMLSLFVNETAIDGRAYNCIVCNKIRSSNPATVTTRRRSSQSEANQFAASQEWRSHSPASGESAASTLYTPATQTLHVSRLPKILRLHLKRFRWIGRQREKICSHVNFPTMLDLSSMVSDECIESGTMTSYQLTGVIVHHGRGFMSGHYTAYCLNDKLDMWLHCNDANMSTCTFNEVAASQAYILFYSQLLPDVNYSVSTCSTAATLSKINSYSNLSTQSSTNFNRINNLSHLDHLETSSCLSSTSNSSTLTENSDQKANESDKTLKSSTSSLNRDKSLNKPTRSSSRRRVFSETGATDSSQSSTSSKRNKLI